VGEGRGVGVGKNKLMVEPLPVQRAQIARIYWLNFFQPDFFEVKKD
jgi:hypothetical protein